MYLIKILPSAALDIKESATWYESKQKGLGKKFLNQVRGKIGRIKRNPYIYAVRYDEIRTAILDIFPFMTHYTVDELQRIIIIVAVLHMSRNPETWLTEYRHPDRD